MQYSPRQIEQYRLLGIENDVVARILAYPQSQAIWNFYWLCTPDVDQVLVHPQDWYLYFKPDGRALAAVIDDVVEDEILYRKLMMSPAQFALWWDRQDVSIFDIFDQIGEPLHDIVLGRAREAAERLCPRVEGNVIHVPFGRRA